MLSSTARCLLEFRMGAAEPSVHKGVGQPSLHRGQESRVLLPRLRRELAPTLVAVCFRLSYVSYSRRSLLLQRNCALRRVTAPPTLLSPTFEPLGQAAALHVRGRRRRDAELGGNSPLI